MQRIQTYGFGDVFPSADLDTFQDNALGINQVSGTFIGWRPYLRAPGDGNLYIGPVALLPMGVSTVLAWASETTFPLSGLTAPGWYYLYAYSNAGVIAFQLVTTAPDAGLQFKAGTTDHAYVGAVYATAANAVLAFRSSNGRYTYRISAIGEPALQAQSLGTSVTFADISLANWVPPHARLATVEMVVTPPGTAGTQTDAFLRTKGDTHANPTRLTALFPVNGQAQIGVRKTLEIETDGSQVIQYEITNPGTLDVYVLGFSE